MNQLKSHLQKACRDILRPLARVIRSALTPEKPPLEFDWQEIHGGPASGCEALLPKGWAISEAICSGTYEQQIMSFVVGLVGRDDCCFDIGGHYGYYTLSLAKLASQGQVHTFEPVAAHAERIEQSANKSGLRNVTVHRVAVASELGEMTLRFAESDKADDSMAYLEAYGGVDTPAAHEHYQAFSRTTVRTVSLDSLVDQLPAPRFIKIDAEGAEGAILEGGRELISQVRPRLLIELHGIYEAIHCAEILSGLHYRAILLTNQKTTMPILWVDQDDHEAIACARDVLGRDPIVLFDQVRPNGQPGGQPGGQLGDQLGGNAERPSASDRMP